MRKLINTGLILGIAGAVTVLGATEARADCQSFTITAVPNPVQEGGETTATVSRTTNADEVSIDVDGISGTAQSGSDFEPVDRTVKFEANGVTSVSFKVKIVADGNAEPAEQFRLRLSNVKGCPPGDSFDVGPDEIVRIVASTGATPAPTLIPTTAPTSRPSSTSTPEATASPSPTVTPSPTPSPSPTFTPFPTATPDSDDDDGTSALAIAGILVAALALLAGIALALYVRRTRL